VGDRVLLIPGHCCSTVNLHDRIYLVEDNRVVDRLAVTARLCGK
jgi:D-serine deaminase-like pyridoxal phosphate-dependent protein